MANEHYRHTVGNHRTKGRDAQIYGVKSGKQYFASLSVREATNLRDSLNEAIDDMNNAAAATAVATPAEDRFVAFGRALHDLIEG